MLTFVLVFSLIATAEDSPEEKDLPKVETCRATMLNHIRDEFHVNKLGPIVSNNYENFQRSFDKISDTYDRATKRLKQLATRVILESGKKCHLPEKEGIVCAETQKSGTILRQKKEELADTENRLKETQTSLKDFDKKKFPDVVKNFTREMQKLSTKKEKIKAEIAKHSGSTNWNPAYDKVQGYEEEIKTLRAQLLTSESEFAAKMREFCKEDPVQCRRLSDSKITDTISLLAVERHEDTNARTRALRESETGDYIHQQKKEADAALVIVNAQNYSLAQALLQSDDPKLRKKAEEITKTLNANGYGPLAAKTELPKPTPRARDLRYPRINIYSTSTRGIFYSVTNDENQQSPSIEVYFNKDCQVSQVLLSNKRLTSDDCLKTTSEEQAKGCKLLGLVKKINVPADLPADFHKDAVQKVYFSR